MEKISLLDYELLTNEVFYRCWHIIEYLENHKDIDELEKEAIKATIMDALVEKNLIDPTKQSLDLDNMCIVDNLDNYCYEEHPNVCGIPLWMKEEYRKKSIVQTGGIPISIFLAKPPSKITHYCVYDPNTAASAIFEDATFYNAFYTSPTRKVRIESQRPFVEVNIKGENYLIDTLTKRILKSDWFKSTYDFEVVSETTVSKMKRKYKKEYDRQIAPQNNLAVMIDLITPFYNYENPPLAEMKYEYEQSKKYFSEEWEKAEELRKEREQFFISGNFLVKKNSINKEDKG